MPGDGWKGADTYGNDLDYEGGKYSRGATHGQTANQILMAARREETLEEAFDRAARRERIERELEERPPSDLRFATGIAM